MLAKEIKVRIRTTGRLIDNLPESACAAIEALTVNRPAQQLALEVEELPPTVNHQYRRNQNGGVRLSQEAQSFRAHFVTAARRLVKGWNPAGAVAVSIFLQSPTWITKKHTIREMDADNRVKAVLDAIQHATGIPDQTNWEIHVYKCASKSKKTRVLLIDLGDVVNLYA